MKQCWVALLVLVFCACCNPKGRRASSEGGVAEKGSGVSTAPCACCEAGGERASQEGGMTEEGKRVSIVGVAREAKVGPVLVTETGAVWIGDLVRWPERVLGRRVRAEGVFAVRADLPVFVRKEGEPEKSGIPVSSPEEVAAARKRTVLTDVKWEMLEE